MPTGVSQSSGAFFVFPDSPSQAKGWAWKKSVEKRLFSIPCPPVTSWLLGLLAGPVVRSSVRWSGPRKYDDDHASVEWRLQPSPLPPGKNETLIITCMLGGSSELLLVQSLRDWLPANKGQNYKIGNTEPALVLIVQAHKLSSPQSTKSKIPHCKCAAENKGWDGVIVYCIIE